MAGMLELSDLEFKTMINIPRALMDKVNSMQEQMSHVSRPGNTKMNHKEMLEIKNTIREMKNDIDVEQSSSRTKTE